MNTVKREGTHSNTIGERIRSERVRLGLSQAEFGAIAGVQKNAQINYEADRRSPDANYLVSIQETGADAHYILTGRREADEVRSILDEYGASGQLKKVMEEVGPDAVMRRLKEEFSPDAVIQQMVGDIILEAKSSTMYTVTPPEPAAPLHLSDTIHFEGHDYAFVRRVDLSISAGTGLVPLEGEESARVAFPAAWLAKAGISADRSVLVRIKGDSMTPQIPDGALVLVHLQEITVERDAVYAFIRDDQCFVKRLVPSGRTQDGNNSSIMIVAANPTYPPEALSGTEMNSIRIVGRVRYVLSAA